jgi:glycogen(starch) synthase
MNVLMLGWEFPPHISGGLGTACFGLTRGLRHNDVHVRFVVPRAHGDEDASYVEIVGCNDVRIPGLARARAIAATGETRADVLHDVARGVANVEAGSSGGARVGVPGMTSSDPDADPLLPGLFELLAVDSPLHPYLDEAAYAQRLLALGGVAHSTDKAEVLAALRELLTAADRASATAAARRIAAAVGTGGAEAAATANEDDGFLSFSGVYGPDLMSEVARYALAVAEIARLGGIDLVHAHDWMTIPAGIVAARIAGKPLVLHVHALEYDRSGDAVNRSVRDIEQMGFLAADRLICVSHYTAGLVRKRYFVDREKVRVVHNAVTHQEQTAAWHVQKAIPEPIVLFLGRITFQKGPDYFLEAAARVVKVEPNVKFVMSGSGDMLPKMIERAARLGLARHMHFTGFLRGKDVERMYAMADIYVMPSVSEPFGISPLEAMALDVPVVVSQQSGVAEILSNALKVDFWDVDDIANKILALLRYPALSEQLREDGKEEVGRLRWEQQGRLVKDVYEELLASQGAR